MKMRKSTWLLLVLALAAILLVAGCSPTTPPNGEEPNGEEPTPPPAGGCPTKVETVVTSLYCGPGKILANKVKTIISPNLSILISFDKDIVLLDNNPANWKVTVDRYVPYYDPGADYDDAEHGFKGAEVLSVDGVVQVSSKLVRITATFKDPEVDFYGLICTEDCYKAFVDAMLGKHDKKAYAEGYADLIKWEYVGGGYPYSDILGNLCPDCDINGEACCVACEICEPPEEHCPIGGCI